jgi:hypothetical protein
VGGTLALWAASLIGILLGGAVLRKIPKVWVHRAAAPPFLQFGPLALAQFGFDRAGIEAPWGLMNRGSGKRLTQPTPGARSVTVVCIEMQAGAKHRPAATTLSYR